MPTAIAENVLFKFGTPDIPEDDPSGYGLHVVNFHGEEGISRPYWFRLNLTSRDPKLDFDGLVNQPGRLTLQRAGRKCFIHGIVSSFEQGGRDGDWFLYRAVLRPRLWSLSLTHRSRVYQHRSVPEIAREILEEHGVPHEIEVRDSYAPREYVVQYNETDLAFVSRLLAHEGIRFIFAQGEQREAVHLFDSRGQDPWVEGPTEVRYQLPDGLVLDETEVVSEAFVREQTVPGKVVLKDYNYRSPASDLTSEEQDSNGRGEVYEYGLHYKDRNEGKRLAKVRKEEVGGQRRILAGRGTAIGFRAGHRFTLHGHFRDDLNEDYLLVRVRHFGGQEQAFGTAGRRDFDGRGTEGNDYRNEFGCTPARVPFRTPRLAIVENFFSDTFFNATFENTIAPVFNLSVAINEGARHTHNHHPHGQMYGLMEAEVLGSGDYGAVDGDGEYVAKMPFERDGADSRPMPLAQPYAGKGDVGFHFPAQPGNKLVFACIDGDPDRPVALGFLPDPVERPSPISAGNSSQHIFRTRSNNLYLVEDKDDSRRVTLETPHQKSTLSLGASYRGNEGVSLITDATAALSGGKGMSLHGGGGGIFISAWPTAGGQDVGKVIQTVGPWVIGAMGALTGAFVDTPSSVSSTVDFFKKLNALYGKIKKLDKLSGIIGSQFGVLDSSLLKDTPVGDFFSMFKTSDFFATSQGDMDFVGGGSIAFACMSGFGVSTLGSTSITCADDIHLITGASLALYARQGRIQAVADKHDILFKSKSSNILSYAKNGIVSRAEGSVIIEAGAALPDKEMKTTSWAEAGKKALGKYVPMKKDFKLEYLDPPDKFSDKDIELRAEDNIKLDSTNGRIYMVAKDGDIVTGAAKATSIWAIEKVEITSNKEIILQCGDNRLRMTRKGIWLECGDVGLEINPKKTDIFGPVVHIHSTTKTEVESKGGVDVQGTKLALSAKALAELKAALAKVQ